MRRGSKPDIIKDGDVFVGFDLSADYCSEHEWGLGFERVFGFGDESKIGIARRRITKLPPENTDNTYGPDTLHFFKNGSTSYLMYCSLHIIQGIKKSNNNSFDELEIRTGISGLSRGVAGAWDERSFGVATNVYHKELQELYEAFKKKDVVIGTFGGGVFENGGLKLLIASRIPKDVSDHWNEADTDKIKLDKASNKTGIHKVLEKAGKGFYALSPSWRGDLDSSPSKYPVRYWLNPRDQNKNNYGYFTVEELQQWAKDKGPVPK